MFAMALPDPGCPPAGLPAGWLLALAVRLAREVRAGRPAAVFALDGRVRFASAADRAAFVTELTAAVAALVGRYHDEAASSGREHRLVIAVHPRAVADPSPRETAENKES
ncbi:MAG: hypothetical protein V7603_6261 [Micromonosporaceae bacterium]